MTYLKQKRGFTLIEMLVVVLIIGILGAIMLPQYQRAVLKSRYSGMMPIAKALAEANEVFYLEHGEYSENPADLLVAGRDRNAGAYPDGTRVLMYDEDGLSYVRVMNDNVPNARYIVYQKHSENFADTTQCEAADDRANELCVALGGQIIDEGNSSGEADWTAYLLSGRYGSGDQLIPANGDNSGDDNGDEGDGNEPGENSGTEPEPQTPPTPQCEGDQPADIHVSGNPATGTAKCINGQWKYEWSGGRVYDTDYSYPPVTVCTGDVAYKCAGAEFKGEYNQCSATQENGCADSIFSGTHASCIGSVANGCEGSTFSGQSYCDGKVVNGCAGTTIQAGASCHAIKPNGCDGAKYGADPTGQRPGIGVCYDDYDYCPNGTPVMGSWNNTNDTYDIVRWKGGYCDPDYMVSGTCPSGSPTNVSDKTTAAGWNGGYCSKAMYASYGNCPNNSPTETAGQCWDGNGGTKACS